RIRVSGGQIRAGRVKCHAKDACLMSPEGANLFAAGYVPDVRGSRMANRSDVLAVLAERDVVDKFGISLKRRRKLSAGQVPELDFLMGPCGKCLALRAEGDAAHHHVEAAAAGEGEFLASLNVPELHGLIHASGKQIPAVGAVVHAESCLVVTVK